MYPFRCNATHMRLKILGLDSCHSAMAFLLVEIWDMHLGKQSLAPKRQILRFLQLGGAPRGIHSLESVMPTIVALRHNTNSKQQTGHMGCQDAFLIVCCAFTALIRGSIGLFPAQRSWHLIKQILAASSTGHLPQAPPVLHIHTLSFVIFEHTGTCPGGGISRHRINE